MKRVFLFLLCLFPFFTACRQKTVPAPDPGPQPEQTASVLARYYFSSGGFSEAESLADVPRVPSVPWTEAVRISAAADIDGAPFFLVNRLGILTVSPHPRLYGDVFLFSDTTADSVVSLDGNPVFHIYKNSFFNENSPDTETPFLVRFKTDSGEFFPVLSTSDLGLPPESQSIDLIFSRNKWISAFKTVSGDRIQFDYLNFFSDYSLLTLDKQQRKTAVRKEEITSDMYQAAAMPELFSDAPQALHVLLEPLPAHTSFRITYRTPDGGTPVMTVREEGGEDTIFEAAAFLGRTYSAALFRDGTFYFSGALKNRPLVKNGTTAVLRLPKLPAGFVYTDFVIDGTKLYAGWEENSFFETARSGFLVINLENVLY